MYSILHTFAGFTSALAGLAIGMCLIIIITYYRVYKSIANGKRLLPIHVMTISTSYIMFAIVAVARLGNPPPIQAVGSFDVWWVYPFITMAFLIGNAALVIILVFIHDRSTRYPKGRKVA